MKKYLISIIKNPKASPVIWHVVFIADEDLKKVKQTYHVRTPDSVNDSGGKAKK